MWLAPTIITDASEEPVKLDDVKAWLRIDGSFEDALLLGLIETAREYAESYSGTMMKERSASIKCASFDDFARLPIGPVQSVTSVVYIDAEGVEQTLSEDVYELVLDGLESGIVLRHGKSWPQIQSGSFITITLIAGYSALPRPIETAMMLFVGQHYETRENIAQPAQTTSVDLLLGNYRRGV